MSKPETADVTIPNKLYFKIGEVSEITGMEPYVIRYWESEFKSIKPSRTQSNQRVYRRKDVESILEIKRMLYEEKLTIAGARCIQGGELFGASERLQVGRRSFRDFIRV